MQTIRDSNGASSLSQAAKAANCQAGRAEKALLLHLGVRDAAEVQIGDEERVALVVPDDTYMDEVLGRAGAQALALTKWLKAYDLNQSTKDAIAAPSGFNTVGWDSSYTRQPLPIEDMREWIQGSVESILQLRAKTIYEIGCGSGLLLMRIAPHCDRYVGIDFSSAVLQRLREQLKTAPAAVADRAETMDRLADDFGGLEPDSFDAVVINSVAQYFPSLAYLTRVLESAAQIVKHGGHIFIGDVRSLPLLPAFAASVELFQAQDKLKIGELKGRIRRRVRNTPELVLSPAYFLELQQRIPRVSRVEINLRTGHADNEMTRYRYNAILHIGAKQEPACDIQFQDWADGEFTLDDFRAMLSSRKGAFGISRVPNARIEKDVLALQLIETADASLSAASLIRDVERLETGGVHPQDLLDLGTKLGFQVKVSWAASRSDGSYDAAFVPSTDKDFFPTIQWPPVEPSALAHFANAPNQAQYRTDLINRVVAHCRGILPEACLPHRIVLMDSIPRSATGAVLCAEAARFEAN